MDILRIIIVSLQVCVIVLPLIFPKFIFWHLVTALRNLNHVSMFIAKIGFCWSKVSSFWSDSNALFVEESFHMTLAFVPSLSVFYLHFKPIPCNGSKSLSLRIIFQGYLFTKFFIALDDSVSSSQAGKLRWFFRSKPVFLKIFWMYFKSFQTVYLYVIHLFNILLVVQSFLLINKYWLCDWIYW